jgi:hypothetical protein
MRRKPSTSASELPERLRYLQSFRRQFASRPPEALNEDSGPAVLMPLFAKRIRGFSDTEAAQVLEQDRAALEQWLSPLGEEGDPLHFALGFLLTASPEEMAKLIREEAEKPSEPKVCLRMELPPGAKWKRVEGAGESTKLVTWKGLWLALDALSEETVANLAANAWHDAGRTDYTVLTVRFGAVTGRKLLLTREDRLGFFKEIAYALAVPGGHVYATLSAIGKNVRTVNWDETPFEACFHTLGVETEPAQPAKPHP